MSHRAAQPPDAPDGDADRHCAICESIGVQLENLALCEEAMAHRSWCSENPGHFSNERLEFLGDAVLGWIAADIAYHRYPTMTEGELTGIRKGVVNATALSEIATDLGLGPLIKLGKGEATGGGAAKPSILSDAMEAVIGAVYLDRGWRVCYEFVERLLSERIDDVAERLHELDFKSTLQELLAIRGRPAPAYSLTATGPDHERHFVAEVHAGEELLGTGEGKSKRAAEQAAAAEAVAALQRR